MKITAVAFIALFGFAFTSCKKEYTCECTKTYTSSNGGQANGTKTKYTYKDNQARAEKKCLDNETTDSDLGGAYTTDCVVL